jgi:hypothetical protein
MSVYTERRNPVDQEPPSWRILLIVVILVTLIFLAKMYL